jgi:hypothetical protein
MAEQELTLQSFAMIVASELARHGLTARVSVLEGKPPTVHVWRDVAGVPPDMHTIRVGTLTHAEIRRVVSEALNQFPSDNGGPL